MDFFTTDVYGLTHLSPGSVERERILASVAMESDADYPEVYRFLDESPVLLNGAVDSRDINVKMLKDYLETLKELIKHYKETHTANGKVLKKIML